MGAYSDSINRNRPGMSPDDVHRMKCAKKKARNEARKEMNRKMMEYQEKNRLSPAEQLKRLDWRFGVGVGAVKERAKLHKRLEETK